MKNPLPGRQRTSCSRQARYLLNLVAVFETWFKFLCTLKCSQVFTELKSIFSLGYLAAVTSASKDGTTLDDRPRKLNRVTAILGVRENWI